MNGKMKIKIGTDLSMFVILMFLMSYEMVGESAHEWLGIVMFLLFLLHHILNRKWIKSILKRKYTLIRLVQTIFVMAILVFFIGSMVSGVILSQHFFKNMTIRGAANLARNIHIISAYWGFVLMAVHLGLHWNMFLKMIENRTGVYNKKVQWMIRIPMLMVVIYGIHAFLKRNIGNYMFLKAHFVFFDFSEPLLLFFVDYLAIAILFIALGHYFVKILKMIYR